MTQIPTLTGVVESSDLGRVLVHEHVFVISSHEYVKNYRDDVDEEALITQAVRELTELKAAGIDTIMDPTVWGLGRYIPLTRRVAEQVPINIIAATGLYTYGDVPFPMLHVGPGEMFDQPDPLPELFVRDLTVGIADTGIRAAFLKCAIDTKGLTPGVERVMRAVGQASVRTGAPITVHTDSASRSGLVAQRVLGGEGVDLRKVVIGHSGDTTDLGYLTAVADQGSLLGMDRFGLDAVLPLADRVATIAELVRRGYTEQIVLSHDAFCFADFFPPYEPRTSMPEWNYVYISHKVLPALLEAGVSQADIDTMLVHNPRRYFE
ncbi:phosphotriesterase family protein [Fodinicola feengrottensis]|uniref:Phosphotriesterase n=1 Tax=Fodinicola feengrottensis TaxID=435914 RepID=A0ABP4TKR8_9ACTN|nr:phosphotriesterase [Fodinicola feengrottensis]